jgi:protein SCO1/2
MKWRTASRLTVVLLAVVVGTLLYVVHGRGVVPALQGTDLGALPAPGFQLTDQLGQSISLGQFRGHPVVLTFLYTHCPGECPLVAEKLRTMLVQLGGQGSGVAILAVSVDPRGDDQAAAQSFSQKHQMLHRWHFLIGTQAQLQPVWSAYHVAVAPGANGSIAHTLGMYVIDQQGRERVYLGGDFGPATLAADLRVLLGS